MAVSAHALCTLTDLKTELGISGSSEDSYLERLINSISEQIERFCNRHFEFEEDIEDELPGFGLTRLIVKKPPIVTLTSVEYEGATIDSDNYDIENADVGIIYRADGWVWTASRLNNIGVDKFPGSEDISYTVTYDGGYVTAQQAIDDVTLTRSLPYDIEDAALQLASMRYREKGSNQRVRQEKLMSYSITYFGESGTLLHGIPMSIAQKLMPYRILAQA